MSSHILAILSLICKYLGVARNKQDGKTLTKPLTKREVTVLAVHLLGGGERSVDTEDIAIKAAELLPGAFSWRKYPEQINLELVRAVLSDSKKPHFGSLLHGSGTEGWRLSDAGVVWAGQLDARVRAGAMAQRKAAPWAGSSDARRVDREVDRVKASLAWQEWKTDGKVSRQAALQLFRIDDYADATMRDIKVARLRRLVAADVEASELIETASKLTVVED
jgi:hypothetical protein